MDSDADSDVVDHPPEFIIHAVDDLAPPPPPPAAAFDWARPPPPRRPPPPSKHVAAVRFYFFVAKVACFAWIVIMCSIMLYFTVHPTPGKSIANERLDVRRMCGIMLVPAVIWIFMSYFSYDDKCVTIDDEEE